MSKSPYVVPSTTTRDVIIGLFLGAIVLAFVIFAIMNMGGAVTGNSLTGTVIAKRFTPLAEQQVTFGKGGIHSRHVEGEYILEVRVREHTYSVLVDQSIYEAKKQGDSLVFPRPAE